MGGFLKLIIAAYAAFLHFLPRPVFLLFARSITTLLRATSFRRKVIEENLQLAFPDWTPEQREELLIKNYEHYGILFLEFFSFFYRFDQYVDSMTAEFIGEENLRRAQEKGKGVFVMTAHIGNWEFLCAHGSHRQNLPVTIATKILKPYWFHQLIEETRQKIGISMAFEPKTMSTIMRALKKNEVVGYVQDQYAGAPVGARVPFFGVPVGTHTAMATLALRTKAAVVPATAIRLSNGKYRVCFEPEIPLVELEDMDESILRNTANYAKHTEGWVRANPEQWLWIHKRWKGDLSPLPEGATGQMLNK